jgi:hypothetical protein
MHLSPNTRLSGYLDIIDIHAGIEGWVLDCENPTSVIRVDLCIGGVIVAKTYTGHPRSDVGQAIGADVAPGFHFGPAVLRLVIARAKSRPSLTGPLQVRVSGTDFEINGSLPLPGITQLAQLMTTAEAPAKVAGNLESLLLKLRDQAEGLAQQKLRPIPENVQGYIEQMTINPAGYVWFTGWMNKGHLHEFSAVISDRETHASGVVLLVHEGRKDLPAHACGIIGVILSDWRPTSLSQNLVLFFGSDAGFEFRATKPLRLSSAKDFLREFADLDPASINKQHGPAIIDMLNDLDHWSISNARTQGFAVYAGIDRILLVPGFGYLVEGWTLSPAKRIDQLQLQVHGKTFHCAPHSLYRKARTDLYQVYPAHAGQIAQSGFVACFIGNATKDDITNPMLKIMFENGGVWYQAIPHDAIRQLGYSANLDYLRQFYPAIEDEAFFPKLAAALRQKPAAIKLRTASLAPANAVLIIILPPDRCDLFYLFADLEYRLSFHSFDFGLAFAALDTSGWHDQLRLFSSLKKQFPIAASLFVAEEGIEPFDVIMPVLEATGAQRFLFAGPSVYLSDIGWGAAADSLSTDNEALVFYEAEPEIWQPAQTATASARCFAWCADSFARWHETTPRSLGGFDQDNGLAKDAKNVIHLKNASHYTRPHKVTTLEAAINASALTFSHVG